MSKNENFDQFLKKSFQNDTSNIKDEGFSEKVVSALPRGRYVSYKKNTILFVLSILSVFIFIVSNGYKSLINSFFEIFSNGVNLIKPSLIPIFIIFVFVSVIFIIVRIEYDRNSI